MGPVSVKRRDEAAGIIMRLATEEMDGADIIFYRTPQKWESKSRGIVICIGLEVGGEYHTVAATDVELKEKPLSTLAPRVVDVCRRLRADPLFDNDAGPPPPRKRKIEEA